MKQCLDKQQTAKLIELGLEKPFFLRRTYLIGELIEMLPMTIAAEIWRGENKGEEGVWALRIDTSGTEYGWDISYERDDSAYLYREGRSELIDALYDMIVLLKEKGVI